MKKFITLLIFFFAISSYSQERIHWQAYSFSIEGSDEDAVVTLLDKQFTSNKPDGVTAYLYNVAFFSLFK